MISFETTREDAVRIGKIVARAKALAISNGAKAFDGLSLHMDLSACIANGTPLRLDELLAADDFNFSHDVFGIRRHIDRDDNSPTAGKLLNCFHPRFAK